MRRFSRLAVLLPSLAAAACATTKESAAPRRAAVDQVLDDWHLAASRADEERYFAHFAPGAVFLGTDATERWTLAQFRAYAHERFATGRGWTYTGRDRHVAFAASGDVAWIDERLDHARYGELRGTGVLLRVDGIWKIAHYSMTFPIPNEVASAVVEMIKGG